MIGCIQIIIDIIDLVEYGWVFGIFDGGVGLCTGHEGLERGGGFRKRESHGGIIFLFLLLMKNCK